MPTLAANPAFQAYAVSILVLCLNLMGLWVYSATIRGKTKTTPNEEDIGSTAKGAKLVDADPPEVARVLRAHKNAMANIVPFAALGLVYVLAGGSATVATVVFGVFTAARLLHSLVYLAGKQPWRTIMFVTGLVDTLVLMGFVVRALVAACCGV